MEGEISGESPYNQSLYEKYFVLTNSRSEVVEFLSWWNLNLIPKQEIKLRNIQLENGDSMPQYLTRFTQCRDELGSVGVTVDDEDGESRTP